MFGRSVGSIKREFNRHPETGIRQAFERLSRAEKLKPAEQMELAGIFAQGNAVGYSSSAVSAAAGVLINIRAIMRNGGILDPRLYPTLLNVIKQGNTSGSSEAMNALADTILRADLTDEERSSLVDTIVARHDIYRAMRGAQLVLEEATEGIVSLSDTKKLADILRKGLNGENWGTRRAAVDAIIDVIHHSRMRRDHGKVIEDLTRDCAAALRSGAVDTQCLNEDERAFVGRMVAFTADGPVPVRKPERHHGIVIG